METFLRFNNILKREMERQQRLLMEGMPWMTLLHKKRKKIGFCLSMSTDISTANGRNRISKKSRKIAKKLAREIFLV